MHSLSGVAPCGDGCANTLADEIMTRQMKNRVRAFAVTRIVVSGILAIFLAFHPQACLAGPITPGWIFQSLNDRIAESEAVLLVKWVSTSKPGENELSNTTFEVVRVAKTPEGNRAVRVGNRITLQYRLYGEPSDFYLIIGGGPEFKALGDRDYWESPKEVTRAGFNSIVQAPSPSNRSHPRLTNLVFRELA